MPATYANIEYLQRFGPSTLSDLPTERVDTADKQAGVAKFDPHVGTVGKRWNAVYYLFSATLRTSCWGRFGPTNSRAAG